MAILNKRKLERVLAYMLDEHEFLGPHGIRSLSRHHLEHPFVFHVGGEAYTVQYLPGESNTGMFGGNSNWRGPVWMPVNALLIRALLNLYSFYGDDFTVQCPTGSGPHMTLFEVARELTRRLASTFLRDANGRGRCTAGRPSSRTIRTGVICSSSMNTSRVTTGRGSAPATRRVDRVDRAPARCVRAYRRQGPGDRTRASVRPARAGAGGRGNDGRECRVVPCERGTGQKETECHLFPVPVVAGKSMVAVT